MELYEATLSDNILINYYDKYKNEYHEGYPQVKNPSALTEGINNVVKKICRGQLPRTVAIYIIENNNDAENPRNARYVITISKGGEEEYEENNYAIKLIYKDTQEMESISTFEEKGVHWSPDNMENTKHPLRTKYYLGFTYLICEHSQGFDQTPRAEKELTGAELIELGVEGELPPESIEIPNVNEYERYEQQKENAEIPDEDDTYINLENPDSPDWDDINGNIEDDYEELFDNENF